MKNLKTLIELVLLIHGIGLIGGIYFIFANESWLSKLMNPRFAAVIGSLIWVVAGIALVATAWALFKDLSWWKNTAYLALVFNTLAGIIWYNAVPGGAIFGVVAADLGILYLLLK